MCMLLKGIKGSTNTNTLLIALDDFEIIDYFYILFMYLYGF
jgi:hypothetical protein